MRGRAADLLLAAGAAVLVTAFWKLRILDPGTQLNFQSVDAFDQIWPMWVRAAESLRSGEVPLWNPYQMGGHPFLASVLYGIFYPLNVARLFLSADLAMEVTLVLHLFVAWLFTYAYCRGGLGFERAGAAAAAVAFALGGFVVFEATWFLPALGAVVWLPLALLAVEKIVGGRRRAAWIAALAVAVAMPVLAGWLQTWLHSMHAIAIYSLVRIAAVALGPRESPVAARVRAAAASALAVGAAVALGTALSAVQILPSMELQALGWRRPGGLTLEQQLLLPPHPPSVWWQMMTDVSAGYPRAIYLGLAVLVLLPLGLALPVSRPSPFLALWALVAWAFGVALTTMSPAFPLYRALPGGTWFRFPARILLLWSLAGSVLAGWTIDRLSREVRGTRRIAGALLLAAVAIALPAAGDSSPRAIGYVAAAVASAAAMLWVPPARRAAAWILVAVIAADAFHATYYQAAKPYRHLHEADREKELLDFIAASQGYGRTFLHDPLPFFPWMMNKQGTLRRIFMVGDYEVLNLGRFQSYCETMAAGPGVQQDPSFVGSCRIFPAEGRARMLERLGVRYAVVARSVAADEGWFERSGWKKVAPQLSSRYSLFENPSPLPRAFVAYSPAVVTRPEDAFAFVADVKRPPTDVVLEGEAPFPGAPAGSPNARLDVAEIRRYEEKQVDITAVAARNGWLVLLDSYYPGWNAYVDGVPATVYRANYLFRAVKIPAGVHHVEFRFEPLPYRIGRTITAATLAILVILVLAGRRHRAGSAG